MTLVVELLNIAVQCDFFGQPLASSTACCALQAGAVVNRTGAPRERCPGRARTQAALQRRAA